MENEHYNQVQCFLFVVENGNVRISGLSSFSPPKCQQIKAYILLPSCIKENNPKICKLLKQYVTVLGNGDSHFQAALKHKQVEVMELILSNEVCQTETLQMSVDSCNKEIVTKIFGRNVVLRKEIARGILSVVDAGNMSVFNHILSVRPNIRLRDSKGGSLLHLAAMRGGTTLVEMLLDHGFKVGLENDEGATPLHLASRCGNLQTVKLLLKKKAAVNAKQKNGATSLHLAAEGGWLEVYKLLSANGASITVGKFDVTVLEYAAVEKGHVDILNDLLELGVALNSVLKKGRTPLYLAVEKGHTAVVKWLLDQGANVLVFGKNEKALEKLMREGTSKSEESFKLLVQHFGISNSKLLLTAISNDFFDVLKVLLNGIGAQVNNVYPKPAFCYEKYEYDEISLIHAAVWKSRNRMVQLLLEKGANVNLKCRAGNSKISPLEIAIVDSNLELVKMLVANGAIVESHEIVMASTVRNAKIIEALLNAGVSSAKILNSALLCAVSNGNLDVVKFLLSRGAVVNGGAIYKAAVVPNAEIMKTLLLNAADLSTDLISPVFLRAVSKGNVAAVKVLLSYGAVVSETMVKNADICDAGMMKTLLLNAVDLSVETINSLFISAVYRDIYEVADVLLKLGADVDAKCSDGSPAFQFVCENCGSDMVKLFVANNANLELKSSMGLTPLFRAARSGRPSVVNQLLAFGARVDILDDRQRPALFHVVVTGWKYIFEDLLDASFQNLGFIFKTNFRKIFGILSSGTEDRELYRKYLTHAPSFCKIFERYLIKVKAANPDFNDKDVVLSWYMSDADDFRGKCEAEIACMKTLTIGDTCVTFHDVLVADTQRLSGLMRNETVRQMLESDDCKERFPIYANIIRLQVQKGLQRRDLMNEGLNICRHLFHDFLLLPLELRERIVNYLSCQNLFVLKYAVTGSMS